MAGWSAAMLEANRAGVRYGVRKGADPLDSLPKIMAVENMGQAEVPGLGGAAYAAMNTVATPVAVMVSSLCLRSEGQSQDHNGGGHNGSHG